MEDLAKYIKPLNINNLNGRFLEAPARHKNNQHISILVVQGMHGSIERYAGLIEYLRGFGNVICPDLPGFGGMQSFYTIGKKPYNSEYADFLATFIRWRFKSKHINIFGVSLGFVFVTKMLQKYPNMSCNMDNIIALGAFADKSDLHEAWYKRQVIKATSAIASYSIGAKLLRYTILSDTALRLIYARHAKTSNMTKSERSELTKYEINLWRINDLRTQGFTMYQMHRAKLSSIKVANSLHLFVASKDRWINSTNAQANFEKIYSTVTAHNSPAQAHAETFATASQVESVMPEGIVKILQELK